MADHEQDVFDQPKLLLPDALSHSTFLGDFAADSFLFGRRHLPLDDLRTELRSYLAKLREELVAVINEDYEDFIGLGIGLRGTDQRIERIRQPVETLKSQVEILRIGLAGIQEDVQAKLDERSQVRAQKTKLKLLLSIHESVAKVEAFLLIDHPVTSSPVKKQPDHLGSGAQRIERVAADYNQLLYLVEKAAGNKCVDQVKLRIDKITLILHQELRSTLVQSLKMPITANFDDIRPKRDALLQCFRTYESLRKVLDAEQVVRIEVVDPWLRKHIHRDALTTEEEAEYVAEPQPTPQDTPRLPHVNGFSTPPTIQRKGSTVASYHVDLLPSSTQPALTALYNKILLFITRDCALLLDVTERRLPAFPLDGNLSSSVSLRQTNEDRVAHGYHLLANVICSTVLDRLASELGHAIYAAGRPDLFHENYSITNAFRDRLESLCPSVHYLETLRAHPSFVAFFKRWQLPVYFQLRFKEIVGRLESTLQGRDAAVYKGASDNFLLPATEATHRALWTAWQPEVYIQDLAGRFWRLTLQLISRHRTFVLDNIRPLLAEPKTASNGIDRSTPATRSSTPVQADSSDEASIRQLTIHIADLQRLESAILDLFTNTISSRLPPLTVADFDDPTEAPLAVITNALVNLASIVPRLTAHAVGLLIKACAEPLRSVRPTAAQIRASNRKGGTEPSYFIATVLRPLKDHSQGSGKLLSSERRDSWYTEVVGEIADRYSAVLVEMRKTDDSLKRFRKGRTGFSLFGSKTNTEEAEKTEEDRVNTQMKVDVQALISDADSIGVTLHNTPKLSALRDTVMQSAAT